MDSKFNYGRAAAAVIIGVMAIGRSASAAEVTADFEDLSGLPNNFSFVDPRINDLPIYGDRENRIMKVSGGQSLTLIDGNDQTTNNVYGGARFGTCFQCAGNVKFEFFKLTDPDDDTSGIPFPVDSVTFTIINPHNNITQYRVLPNGLDSNYMKKNGKNDPGEGRTRIFEPLETVEITRTAADLGVESISSILIVDAIQLRTFYVDNIIFDDGGSQPSIEVTVSAFVPANYVPAAPTETCVAMPEQTSDGQTASARVYRGSSVSVEAATERALVAAGDVGGDWAVQSVSVLPGATTDEESVVGDIEKDTVGEIRFFAEDALDGDGRITGDEAGNEADEEGDCKKFHRAVAPDNSKMDVEVESTGDDTVSVRFTGSVRTHLGGGKAGKDAMDWNLLVTIDSSDNSWTVSGAHDGFPAFAIDIGGENVYTSDLEGPFTSFNADVRKKLWSMSERVNEVSP